LTFFMFNPLASPSIYPLSLHDALPISLAYCGDGRIADWPPLGQSLPMVYQVILIVVATALLIVPQWFSTYTKRQHSERLAALRKDRKSTRLNSSHVKISYAVFCLKKKT